jgi:hypothetical protein
VQVVLGPRGEHEAHRPRVRCLSGGGDPLGRRPHVVNGAGVSVGEILNRAARQPGFHGQGDGPRDAGRLVGEAVLQVGGDRKVGRGDYRGGVGEGIVAAHRAVQAAQRRGVAGTRRGERVEAKRGEQPRRSLVPWIRQQQRVPWAVQLEEPRRLLALVCHSSERTVSPTRQVAPGPTCLRLTDRNAYLNLIDVNVRALRYGGVEVAWQGAGTCWASLPRSPPSLR